MSDFDTLADRIRSEAALASRPGQMERLESMADEVERLRSGAKTLGHTIEQQCRMVLDITGLHDWIDEDGDGDWGSVWDHLYDLPARAWDEGYKQGGPMCDENHDDPDAHTRNPYRREAKS